MPVLKKIIKKGENSGEKKVTGLNGVHLNRKGVKLKGRNSWDTNVAKIKSKTL